MSDSENVCEQKNEFIWEFGSASSQSPDQPGFVFQVNDQLALVCSDLILTQL